MADDPSKENSPRTEPAEIEANEDAETRATRRELKQSTLSDAAPSTAAAGSDTEQDNAADPTTPPQDASDSRDQDQDQLKDDVLSPKKKRAHDQLDKDHTVDDNDATSIASTDSAKDRASRLEPEKKRHRDGEVAGEQSEAAVESAQSTADKAAPASATTQNQTSTSAFSASGFGKLAAGASPFASLSGAKSTGFGSAKSPPPAQPAAPPKLTFGGGSTASPFAGLGSNTSNGFGSAFGGGSSSFGSAFGVAKPLSSFAAPGSKPLKSEKPAKPFGAPDSDAEDADDDEGDEEEDVGEEKSQPDEERIPSPEKEPEEKRKLKLQRVEVNDGEAGEATIVSVRAKVFYHDKEVGWKERGAGMLKINVPENCLDFDALGVPIPGSFDASGLEPDAEDGESGGDGPKVARLILRQDQTHRVILNTAIVPAMNFQEKASLKSVGIIFTAFEGEEAKPVNITVKMTAANAKAFMNEINIVQKELRER